MTKKTTKPLKQCLVKVVKVLGSGHAVQKGDSLLHQETGSGAECISQGSQKTKYCCFVESHESTRQRVEPSLPKNSLKRRCRERIYFDDQYNVVHKFIPLPQAMKIPDAKAAVDKEWKKLETIPARQLVRVKSKKESFLKHTKTKRTVHFATLMDTCLTQNAELEPKLQKNTKAESCSIMTLYKTTQKQCQCLLTGLVSVPKGCSKSNGCCCKITRL